MGVIIVDSSFCVAGIGRIGKNTIISLFTECTREYCIARRFCPVKGGAGGLNSEKCTGRNLIEKPPSNGQPGRTSNTRVMHGEAATSGRSL